MGILISGHASSNNMSGSTTGIHMHDFLFNQKKNINKLFRLSIFDPRSETC